VEDELEAPEALEYGDVEEAVVDARIRGDRDAHPGVGAVGDGQAVRPRADLAPVELEAQASRSRADGLPDERNDSAEPSALDFLGDLEHVGVQADRRHLEERLAPQVAHVDGADLTGREDGGGFIEVAWDGETPGDVHRAAAREDPESGRLAEKPERHRADRSVAAGRGDHVVALAGRRVHPRDRFLIRRAFEQLPAEAVVGHDTSERLLVQPIRRNPCLPAGLGVPDDEHPATGGARHGNAAARLPTVCPYSSTSARR
jgi:hypothetical protein